MTHRQETDSSGWRGLKLETSFQWGNTRISTRAYLICIYINDREEVVATKIVKYEDDTF